MALISKASLLMVPSTYTDGTLYNVLPSGNRAPDNKGGAGYDQTRADFTFDRGNNLAATRIDENGVLQKGRENVLLQSNSFDTTWVNFNTSETSGESGYDGSSNAWKLSNTGASGYIRQTSLTASGVQTFSIYAKAGSLNWLRVTSQSGNVKFNINLSDGTIGTTGNLVIEAKATALSDGWYRCSMTFNASTTGFYIYPATDDDDTTQTSGNIIIQDAQLETGMVATEVMTSGSTTAKAGVLEDMPRINYDANGENGALLLEPLRTNLFETSEYFETSDWSESSLTIETNKDTSPEGVKNASKIYPSASGSISYLYNVKSGVSATYTISAYVKANGKNIVWLYINNGSANGTIYFDLSDQSKQIVAGSAHTPTGDIESLGNDWYKITFTTGGGIILNSGSGIGVSDVKGSTSVTKNGEDGVLVYGLQIEAGSHVSSYIPTHGSAVSRSADVCNSGGSAESINSTEGVLYAEISSLINPTNQETALSISEGQTGANRLLIRMKTNGSIGMVLRVSNTTEASIDSSVLNQSTNHKIAVKYKVNDIALWIDGVEIGTDTSANVFSANTLDEISFNQGNNSNHFYGNVKQLAVFNEALSDAELATLTTL